MDWARIGTKKTAKTLKLMNDAMQERFFFSLGFLTARAIRLEAFVPKHRLDTFVSRFAEIKGRELQDKEKGLYVLAAKAHKWGYELRVTFLATPEEISLLDYGSKIKILDDPSKHGVLWRINNNAFWWKLLEFGFEMGGQQKVKAIEAHIPKEYQEKFRQGYSVTP